MSVNKLKSLTEELLQSVDSINERFAISKESGVPGDFYQEVKPFADGVKQKSDEWAQEAMQWIAANRPKNLHPNQINSATEQMELISVQAFFPEVSKTRFINYSQSVQYVLKVLRDYLSEEDL
ncbi:YppE family protein [Cytobacillus spongiae]|uniref:YppE family protein n=1 Tax=Cytobacillus spongiae TaxID=2901381 RepID=UPI001F45B9BE|nr:YppE family protein [Cytobacillus spongiae]UII54598.1 YppE family protein [Cytobacillus spongiae]